MAIGLTPKAQTIETINYVSAVEDFEEGATASPSTRPTIRSAPVYRCSTRT